MRVDESSLTDQVSSTASRAAESQRIQVDTAATSGASGAGAGGTAWTFPAWRDGFRKLCRRWPASPRNVSANCRRLPARAVTSPTRNRLGQCHGEVLNTMP